jgi:hypothetical protein
MHDNEINLCSDKQWNKLLWKIVDTSNYLTNYSEDSKDYATEVKELWELCQKKRNNLSVTLFKSDWIY